MYWGRAAHRPLNIRPDINDDDIEDERIGPKFLWEFEQAKKAQEQIVENGSAIESAADEGSSDKIDQSITQNGSAIEGHAEEKGQAITQNGSAIERAKEDEAIYGQSDKEGELSREPEQLELATELPKSTADKEKTKE
jgi:hypothetical protein